jgi:hypothetical protein
VFIITPVHQIYAFPPLNTSARLCPLTLQRMAGPDIRGGGVCTFVFPFFRRYNIINVCLFFFETFVCLFYGRGTSILDVVTN